MRKLVEKMVAEQLLQFCKTDQKLHIRQMGAWKNRCAVDVVAIMVNSIYKIWEQKKIMGVLLIDVKGAFDYVSKLKMA